MMARGWPAPAKLNLYLHVTGRRADGYHLLDSLAAFSDIGDRLNVAPAPRLALAITGPFARDLAQDDPRKNLVWRAAEALAARLGRTPDVALTLEKNLPVASGIGGGSSDAAAALKALAAHWQASLDERALCAIAAELGADVPVCVVARASFFGGIGDEIVPAPALPPAPLLLVNPGIALPTASVFRARQGAFSPPRAFCRRAGIGRATRGTAQGAPQRSHRCRDRPRAGDRRCAGAARGAAGRAARAHERQRRDLLRALRVDSGGRSRRRIIEIGPAVLVGRSRETSLRLGPRTGLGRGTGREPAASIGCRCS